MNITIDLNPIYDFFKLPPDVLLIKFLLLFGWIPLGIIILYSMKEVWLHYIRLKWLAEQKFSLLAIDIPRGNTQSPKAVENIFAYLAGAYGGFTLVEKYWEGMFQLPFSLEIVSIDGYTQFLIHTPTEFRDLVESAVYSQYPDAEITEVNDYTEEMPRRFPDEEYNMWGAEFIQANSPAYPIKLYEEFMHLMGEPEEHFKDPMASLMDLYSSLKKGEQIWFQVILIPTDFDWTSVCDKEISKILGEKRKADNIFDKLISGFMNLLWSAGEVVYRTGAEGDNKQEKDDGLKMFNLKPKEKRQIDSIQIKAGKVGFEFKSRFIYISKKEVMNKPKAINGFVGYIKQFASLDLNNLKPEMKLTGTSASYFNTEKRISTKQTRLINKYIKRDYRQGRKPGILNIEELATIWHFPVEAVVKAPLIQKAAGRRAEPPMGLPMGEEVIDEQMFVKPRRAKRDIVKRSVSSYPRNNERTAPDSLPISQGPAPKLNEQTMADTEADEIFGKMPETKIPPEKKAPPPSNLPIG